MFCTSGRRGGKEGARSPLLSPYHWNPICDGTARDVVASGLRFHLEIERACMHWTRMHGRLWSHGGTRDDDVTITMTITASRERSRASNPKTKRRKEVNRFIEGLARPLLLFFACFCRSLFSSRARVLLLCWSGGPNLRKKPSQLNVQITTLPPNSPPLFLPTPPTTRSTTVDNDKLVLQRPQRLGVGLLPRRQRREADLVYMCIHEYVRMYQYIHLSSHYHRHEVHTYTHTIHIEIDTDLEPPAAHRRNQVLGVDQVRLPGVVPAHAHVQVVDVDVHGLGCVFWKLCVCECGGRTGLYQSGCHIVEDAGTYTYIHTHT